MFIIYDQNFNGNELFVITALIIGSILVWKLPKRFSTKETLIYLTYFVFLGMTFDHTISINPTDYYDVNDISAYQLMDFLSYLTYGPVGYLFVYFYDFFRIKNSISPIYVLLGAVVATIIEYFAQTLGVFHYKNGYTIFYSFPIYLLILMSHLFLYKFVNQKAQNKT